MKLLIVCGPTATGKTKLAAQLARQFNGELISADSRQVYRGMDIGTGKEIIPDIPTWLLDVVNPDEEFSVAHFQKLAREAIADIHGRGKLPIMVGGTGLYIQSLLAPIETVAIPPNTVLRKELDGKSVEELREQLKKEDPETWYKMNGSDRYNPRRLIRKIEIAHSIQRRPYMAHSSSSSYSSYDSLIVGLTAPYDALYKRIDQRVEERVKNGVEDEVKGLLQKGYTFELPSMNTLGYKEWQEYFLPPTIYDLRSGAIERWKFHEHAYARRQMTWFKKMPGIHWVDIRNKTLVNDVMDMVRPWYT